jgi:TetR/AcrR family transcriptional regulator, transcriptional repressor for nem operon
MGRPSVDTKQILIDTARELIWKRSYGSVSVDAICKTANVKKGSFYHFFSSKVELAIAAMEDFYCEMEPFYDTIFCSQTPPIKRFERLADFMIAKQEEAAQKYGRVCGCPCASLGSEMAGQEAGIRAKFDDVAQRNRRYYEDALRDMITDGLLSETTNVKTKAEEIYAFCLGQLMISRIQNDLTPLKRDLKLGLLRLLGVTGRLP